MTPLTHNTRATKAQNPELPEMVKILEMTDIKLAAVFVFTLSPIESMASHNK